MESNSVVEQLRKEIDDLKRERDFWVKEIRDLETFLIRKFSGPFLDFEVHLSEHCNLNCQGCDHFSPLAPVEFPSYDTFCRDFGRMRELFGNAVHSINLLGGEPLLNMDIVKYVIASRRYFPYAATEIRVVTNGILIPKMEPAFWEACGNNRVHVAVTKYPIGLDYDAMFDLARQYGVKLSFYDPEPGEKTLYRTPLRLAGDMDPRRSYYKCACANMCCFLKNGRMYTCSLIPNICHFSNYFGIELPVTNEDSIDIYQASSKEEIFNFLSRPVPFCRFCDSEGKEYGMQWKKSERMLEEWIQK